MPAIPGMDFNFGNFNLPTVDMGQIDFSSTNFSTTLDPINFEMPSMPNLDLNSLTTLPFQAVDNIHLPVASDLI